MNLFEKMSDKKLVGILFILLIIIGISRSQSLGSLPPVGVWTSNSVPLGCNKANFIEARIVRVSPITIFNGNVNAVFEVRTLSGSAFKTNGKILITPISSNHCPGERPNLTARNSSVTHYSSGAKTVRCQLSNLTIPPCESIKLHVYQLTPPLDSLGPTAPESSSSYAGVFEIHNPSFFSFLHIPNNPVSDLANTIRIKVISCKTWVASSNSAWAQINPSSSNTSNPGSTTVQINFLRNTSSKSRDAIIKFSSLGINKTITVTQRGSGINCNPPNIGSNNRVSGNTSSGSNNIYNYSIRGLPLQNYNGKEIIYKYQHMGRNINVLLSRASPNINVIVLSECSPDSGVLLGRNNIAAVAALPPGQYFIVVDGINNTQGSYSLLVSSN